MKKKMIIRIIITILGLAVLIGIQALIEGEKTFLLMPLWPFLYAGYIFFMVTRYIGL